MRAVRIPFDTKFLFDSGGLPKKLMSAIMEALPQDATVLGFSEEVRDMEHRTSYMYIQSDMFKEVPEGGMPPDISIVVRKIGPDTDPVLEKIEYYNTLASISDCTHQWAYYRGFFEAYMHCSKCGVKQGKPNS